MCVTCVSVCVSCLSVLQAMAEPEIEYVTGFPLIHSLLDVRSPYTARRPRVERIPSKWKTDIMIVFALFLR